MAAASGPVTLVGRLAALPLPRSGGRGRAVAARLAAAAREHATTVAALASIDLGCFRAAAAAGWIVTGVSLLVLEWKVRG